MNAKSVEDLIAQDDVNVVLHIKERADGSRKIVKLQYVQRSNGKVLVSRAPRHASASV